MHSLIHTALIFHDFIQCPRVVNMTKCYLIMVFIGVCAAVCAYFLSYFLLSNIKIALNFYCIYTLKSK